MISYTRPAGRSPAYVNVGAYRIPRSRLVLAALASALLYIFYMLNASYKPTATSQDKSVPPAGDAQTLSRAAYYRQTCKVDNVPQGVVSLVEQIVTLYQHPSDRTHSILTDLPPPPADASSAPPAIHSLVKFFNDAKLLETCSPEHKSASEWFTRMNSQQCTSKLPVDKSHHPFLYTQVYHAPSTWDALLPYSVGFENGGGIRSTGGECDVASSALLPSLYESSFATQLAESSSLMALGFSLPCFTSIIDTNTTYIGTSSWKPDKWRPPCNLLREHDLHNDFAVKGVESLVWNCGLGDHGYVTSHKELAPVDHHFWHTMFGVHVPADRRDTTWLWNGVILSCCSQFLMKSLPLQSLAKLHAIALSYLVVHYGDPLLCPWNCQWDATSNLAHCNRCWGYWTERLTSVYLRFVISNADISTTTVDYSDRPDEWCNTDPTYYDPMQLKARNIPGQEHKMTTAKIDEIYEYIQCRLEEIR